MQRQSHQPPEHALEPSRTGLPIPRRKRLDTVVKLGLGVFVGSFALIWGGMFLTRPDRSIPPYSIGSQEGTTVAVHVPSWTSDARIETLIQRFRQVGRETRDFGSMKIQATTPGDPHGRYRRISIYIFTHDAWAEPEVLHRYLETAHSSQPEDTAVREGFEKAVRGFYRLDESMEEGRIGPVSRQEDSPATAAYSRVLFKGPVTSAPPQLEGSSRSTLDQAAGRRHTPDETGPSSSGRPASREGQGP